MKIFITGDSGFIGNYLCKYLTALDFEISGIDIAETHNINHTHFNGSITDKEIILMFKD